MRTSLHYSALDSTAREYERLSALGRPGDGWAVRSAKQTNGMGRGQNIWLSPAGGLYLSFDLTHSVALPSFPLYVGYCLHKLLSKLYNLQNLTIKWPNDIYLDNAKLVGVICKYQPAVCKYIIGIGINTNINAYEVALEKNIAILRNYIGMDISNSNLARLIIQTIKDDARILGEPSSYIVYCDSCLCGKNDMAEIILGVSKSLGRIVGLAPDGSLIMNMVNGESQVFSCGSLRLLQKREGKLFLDR